MYQFFLASPVDHRALHSFPTRRSSDLSDGHTGGTVDQLVTVTITGTNDARSEEHTSELQSLRHIVCRPPPKKTNTGTIAFNDVDLTDAHTTSVTAAATNTLAGTMTMRT